MVFLLRPGVMGQNSGDIKYPSAKICAKIMG